MSENCTHNCSTCGKSCGERKAEFDFSAKLNAASKVGKVIAVASGKVLIFLIQKQKSQLI